MDAKWRWVPGNDKGGCVMRTGSTTHAGMDHLIWEPLALPKQATNCQLCNFASTGSILVPATTIDVVLPIIVCTASRGQSHIANKQRQQEATMTINRKCEVSTSLLNFFVHVQFMATQTEAWRAEERSPPNECVT